MQFGASRRDGKAVGRGYSVVEERHDRG